MRPRCNLEYLGNLAVVLATVITLALLGLAGSFKIVSAELVAQVAVLQDPSRAAPRGFLAQQVTAVLAAIDVSNHFERSRLARLNVQKIDIYRLAFRDAILPSTSLDDCVGHKVFSGEKKPRKISQK